MWNTKTPSRLYEQQPWKGIHLRYLNRIDDSRDLRGEEVVIYYSYISDSPKQCMSKGEACH